MIFHYYSNMRIKKYLDIFPNIQIILEYLDTNERLPFITHYLFALVCDSHSLADNAWQTGVLEHILITLNFLSTNDRPLIISGPHVGGKQNGDDIVFVVRRTDFQV